MSTSGWAFSRNKVSGSKWQAGCEACSSSTVRGIRASRTRLHTRGGDGDGDLGQTRELIGRRSCYNYGAGLG